MHSCVDCELLGGAVMGEDDHILRKDRLHIVNAQTKEWLQSRGYPVPQQKLTSIQKRETQECFALLDADGSGTLDVDEVMTAFTMLGLPVKRFDILKLFKAVDPEGNHELQYPAFEKMMTIATADNNGNSQSTIPFSQVARAYHRAKTIEDMIEGGDALQKVLKSLVNHENMGVVRTSAPPRHSQSPIRSSDQFDVTELCRSMDQVNASSLGDEMPEDMGIFSRVCYCPYLLVDPNSRTRAQPMKDAGGEIDPLDSKYRVVSVRSGTKNPVQISIEMSSCPEPPQSRIRAREPQTLPSPAQLGKGRPCSGPVSLSHQSLQTSNEILERKSAATNPEKDSTPPKPVTAPCLTFPSSPPYTMKREVVGAAPAFGETLNAPMVPIWMENHRQKDVNSRDVRLLCETLSSTKQESSSISSIKR